MALQMWEVALPSTWTMDLPFALWTVLSAVGIYVLLIALSRWVGPRSFSQMTAFDFAVTVALGAIVGSTAAGAVGLPAGMLALASLFALRASVAALRRHGLNRVVDNRPLLLFSAGTFHDESLRLAKVTRDDVMEGLRLAGVTRLSEVGAVIIERNGELSVLRGSDIDDALFENISDRG